MAVKSLAYVVIGTEQPDLWDHFLTQVAGVMRASNAADGAAQYRIDDRPFRFRVERAEGERLLAAGYEVSEADFDRLASVIPAVGRPVTVASADEAATRCVGRLLKTSDPADNSLEFFCCDTRDEVPFVSPVGVPKFVTGAMGMGHAVFAAPNFAETHAFYRDTIGFRDTDLPAFHLMGPEAPPMHFAFMHADNGRHHSIALGEGPVPPSGCVHLMLEYPDLTEVGKAHDRMKAHGYIESATLGRHQNDETIGFYVQTPGGFDLEIGCDSLVIDPRSWAVTRHEGISVWGHEWSWQKALKQAEAAA